MNKRIYLAIISVSMLWACTTVPITGRKQFTKGISSERIIQMSAEAYKQVMDSVPLSQDEEKVQMIKRVGNQIKNAVEKYMLDSGFADVLEGFDWEFNLIANDTTINAWAMPGGKVAFYTGILPICQTDLGVAVVMGHEVAHAVAKHGQERMSQTSLASTLFGVAGAVLGENPSASSQAIYKIAGAGTNVGLLSFSRTHESEADELGLTFMAIAGYDPREAPKFWERMSAGGGSGVPQFLSTHPSHETRISRLNDALPGALKFYKGDK